MTRWQFLTDQQKNTDDFYGILIDRYEVDHDGILTQIKLFVPPWAFKGITDRTCHQPPTCEAE